MSSINIATKTLLAHAPVTAIVGQRVYPVFIPQNAKFPLIRVSLVSEPEWEMLAGGSQIREGRVAIESVTDGNVPQLFTLSEAVIDAMRDRVEYAIAGCIATMRKAGSDETDHSDETNAQGVPSSVRRITDFYIVWRKP